MPNVTAMTNMTAMTIMTIKTKKWLIERCEKRISKEGY